MSIDNQHLKDNIVQDKLTIQEMLKTHTESDVYPIATFCIFSKFVELEQFIIKSYINYALGENSINGFKPIVKVDFKNEETLKKFHKQIDKFITIKTIKEVYQDMFGNNTTIKNPFFNFFNSEYTSYEKLESIRNVIAHQSEEAYKKFYDKCNSGAPCSLEDYLFKYNGKFYNFDYWLKFMEELSESIVNPI